MNDQGIMLTFNENGEAVLYDDSYDIVIHCESEEEHNKIVNMLIEFFNNFNKEKEGENNGEE